MAGQVVPAAGTLRSGCLKRFHCTADARKRWCPFYRVLGQVLAGGARGVLVGGDEPPDTRDVAAALQLLDWHRPVPPWTLLVPLPHGQCCAPCVPLACQAFALQHALSKNVMSCTEQHAKCVYLSPSARSVEAWTVQSFPASALLCTVACLSDAIRLSFGAQLCIP